MGVDNLTSGKIGFGLLQRHGDSGGFTPGPAYFLRPWIPAVAVGAAVLSVAGIGALTIRARDGRALEMAAAGESRRVRILAVQQNTDPRKHDYRLSFEELSRLTEEALLAYGGRVPPEPPEEDSGPDGRTAVAGMDTPDPPEPIAASDQPFDLVAWPESGFVPDMRFWLDDTRLRRSRSKLVREMLDWQSAAAIHLVTGTQDHFYEDVEPDPEDPEAPTEVKRIQNSAVFLTPDRKDNFDREYYYKIRLVPFTENFPYEEQFPKVAELLHNFSTTQWTPGTEHHVFRAPAFRFSTPICFEDVFPDHLRRFVLAGAEVFVNMSNDYWANTPLEGYQHAAHAVFRTVENRRPLIRATCSGWTISVDPEGRISDEWPQFYTPGYVVGEYDLPNEQEMTFYTKTGDWLPVICGIIWIALLAGEFIFRRKRNL